jgi:hypothetical protein
MNRSTLLNNPVGASLLGLSAGGSPLEAMAQDGFSIYGVAEHQANYFITGADSRKYDMSLQARYIVSHLYLTSSRSCVAAEILTFVSPKQKSNLSFRPRVTRAVLLGQSLNPGETIKTEPGTMMHMVSPQVSMCSSVGALCDSPPPLV